MPYQNFSNLDGTSYQEGNPGGLRKVLVVLSKGIVGNWPSKEDITAGEITTAPELAATYSFAEYEFPDSTAEATSSSAGDPGFQAHKHGIELMVAGFSKTIQAELRKHLNAGSVWIVEMNDGQFVVVGASDNPIFINKSLKTGKKGSEKRGFTLKGEQDGFMWDLLPLSTAALADLDIQA